jgi:excisionase family DNA binding protein
MATDSQMKPLAHQLSRAAQITGISTSLLYELIKHGELAVVKIGRRTLIADDDLRALIDRNRVVREARHASSRM